MKVTAAVVPVRSAPFEIETLDLATPLADEGASAGGGERHVPH
jgi:Zn-dependent alcohol dehydrogenase